MAFKENTTPPPKGRAYKKGAAVDSFIFGYKVKQQKAAEEEKFGPEREKRINFQHAIADMVDKNWPEEEIINNITANFSDTNSAQVKHYIDYWKEQRKTVFSKIDEWVEKLKIGEFTQPVCKNRVKNLCFRFKLFKKSIWDYYESKINSLGDDER